MSGYCEEFERFLESGSEGEQARLRKEHLQTCPECRAQVAADAVLREAFVEPLPELSLGFETRLRRRLEARRAPTGWRPVWGWTLAAYVTAATFASIAILSHLPWPTLVTPKLLGLAVVALLVASPLLLLDRIGILRPPG